jgi:hypothetical protein
VSERRGRDGKGRPPGRESKRLREEAGHGAAEALRLQVFLARAGVASRRAAEGLIEQGRVAVNGTVVTELGTKVDPQRDQVAVDGVQHSTRYPAGVTLRFARLIRYRPDKSAADADTVDTVRELLG